MAAETVPELKALGRYTIERTIGQGAMGVVYEGVDPTLGRKVAVKTILKTQLDPETAKDYSKRFLREAKAVARLNHPNIVQVYDFGEEGDVAYLVMEYIRGKELKSFFEANERFELKEAVRIMGELCEALEFAHNTGIIHRDIKPANVMLDAQGRTKLTDFGVARVTDSDKTVERTQAGTLVGTPAYMSPEQITGVNVDKRSDVFSAGIILYQFLTGEKPFSGSGAWTIAKKILHEEPPLPSSLNNAVTPLFDAVVNRALAKNPDQRFQSARDLAMALKRALEGRPEEDPDKTVAGPMAELAAPMPRAAETSGASRARTQEVELEFWRTIKDGSDAADFELYVEQFPTGIYAALAKRRIAKLRGVQFEDAARALEQEKKELEEAARREAEAKAKLEAEKARLLAEMARKEAEFRHREAEEKAKREAELKLRTDEEARRHAEFAKREAELRERVAVAESTAGARKPAVKYGAAAALVIAAVAGTVIYIQMDRIQQQRDAAIEQARQADEARRRAEELSAKADAAIRQANDAFTRFQEAVQAENRARAAGDAEKLKQFADARRQAEDEAIQRRKLAEALVKQADDARRNAPPLKPAPKPAASETPTAPLAASSKSEAPSAATPDAPKSSATETAKAPATETPKAPSQGAERGAANPLQLAQNFEAEGNGREAVRAYATAARAGNCEAARRLGQIYEKGIRGVPHDYQESLSWYGRAEKLGCKVQRTSGRA